MQNYISLTSTVSPVNQEIIDILIAELFNLGYEGIQEISNGVIGYIPEDLFNIDYVKSLDIVNNELYTFNFISNTIEEQNWNEEWEKNYFKSIVIGNDCLVKASFHDINTPAKYKILIDPKMSFGTGHHETTTQVIEEMLLMDLQSMYVLDMGCGTGILAILASMMGAEKILAIDIDEWAYENSLENCKLNNIENVIVQQGDVSAIEGFKFDLIIANINRNILLSDIKYYAKCLMHSGYLIMSGFYTDDLDDIRLEAESHGLTYITHRSKNNWVAVKFQGKLCGGCC